MKNLRKQIVGMRRSISLQKGGIQEDVKGADGDKGGTFSYVGCDAAQHPVKTLLCNALMYTHTHICV